jgi:hypothetical protein
MFHRHQISKRSNARSCVARPGWFEEDGDPLLLRVGAGVAVARLLTVGSTPLLLSLCVVQSEAAGVEGEEWQLVAVLQSRTASES